jgi:hypothetical protein
MPRPKRDITARFRRAARVEAREVGDEYFLVALGPGTTHHLNRMASAVWRALAKPTTTDEMVALFHIALPDAPKRKIARDVTDLLAYLENSKLIVRLKPKPPGKLRS